MANKHSLSRIDNMTAVVDIAKIGTCHSRKRYKLTQDMWDWCIGEKQFSQLLPTLLARKILQLMLNLESQERKLNGL